MDPTEARIKYYTEWIKILWLTLVANVGGVIGLILGAAWPLKIWVVLAGAILAGVFISLIVVLHMVIETLIRRREKNSA